MTEPPHPSSFGPNPFNPHGAPSGTNPWSHWHHHHASNNTYYRPHGWCRGRGGRGGKLVAFALGAGVATLYYRKGGESCSRREKERRDEPYPYVSGAAVQQRGDERTYGQWQHRGDHGHHWRWRSDEPSNPTPSSPPSPNATIAAQTAGAFSTPAPSPTITADEKKAWIFDGSSVSDLTDQGLETVIGALSQLRTHLATEAAKEEHNRKDKENNKSNEKLV